MTYFAFYYYDDGSEILASDGCLHIDGRLNLDNAINIAIDHIEDIKRFKPSVTGFKLYRVNHIRYINDNTKPIYQYKIIEKVKK